MALWLLVLILCLLDVSAIGTRQHGWKKRISNATNPLYWVPTQEGILSQFFQIQALYNIALITSRTVVVGTFLSPVHYGDEEINLCKFFEFPEKISCMRHEKFAYEKDCVIVGNAEGQNHTLWESYFFDRKALRLPPQTRASWFDFDYSTQECVAGYIFRQGVIPQPHKWPSVVDRIKLPVVFRQSSTMQRFEEAKQKAGFGGEYITVHWRRGDQLRTRCTTTYSWGTEKSLNCASADDFITAIKGNISANDHYQNLPIYIATNEENRSSLLALRQQGWKLYDDIATDPDESAFYRQSRAFRFVAEFQLSCQAYIFVSWGVSSMHKWIHSCRSQCEVISPKNSYTFPKLFDWKNKKPSSKCFTVIF